MVKCAAIVTLGGEEKPIQGFGAKCKETTWKTWA